MRAYVRQTGSKPTVDVVVAGRHDPFGTPRAINRAGLLRYLCTDLYGGSGSWLSLAKPRLRALDHSLEN